MKIVQVIHGFPPHNMAGSEVYTYNLSRELAKQDEVFVFYRIADPEREEYEMKMGTFDGISVCTINNTFKFCDSFEKTYRNEVISEKFGGFLDEVKPDIAHFGHLTCLSTTLIEETKKRKIPVVFTLHDFWLFCQLGQLLKRDLSLCNGPKDSECARCLAPQLVVNGKAKKVFELMRTTVPIFAREALQGRLVRELHRQYDKVFFYFQKQARAQIAKRRNHILEICAHVDLFIAPSNFLRSKFVEFGIPEDKIRYYDYGFNTALFNHAVKTESQKIRFGYIGTFIPSKGVHVMLDAFNKIKSQRAELRIYGKFAPYHPGFEDYPDYLRTLGGKDHIQWLGEYDNRDIAKILSEIEVLIVPSIWYENSPLTIHEAFMAGIPVIASNIGGMAELVQHEVNGLLFQVGDSQDLAKKIQIVIDQPDLIEKFKKNINPIIPMEDHAATIRRIYQSLMRNENSRNGS